MVSKATGMVEVGAALLIIGEAVRNMGGMSWDEIARGLVTLAGSMTILVVALNAMKTALPGAQRFLPCPLHWRYLPRFSSHWGICLGRASPKGWWHWQVLSRFSVSQEWH